LKGCADPFLLASAAMGADHRTTTVDATADDALGSDDMIALLARLEAREVSAGELRDAAVARARSVNARLNAVAAWVDENPRTFGAPPLEGLLAGIPTVIKDNEDLAGYATTQGSWAMPERPAKVSSPFVSQYLELGVAAIAKTTMPEFGLTASTESLRFGRVSRDGQRQHQPGYGLLGRGDQPARKRMGPLLDLGPVGHDVVRTVGQVLPDDGDCPVRVRVALLRPAVPVVLLGAHGVRSKTRVSGRPRRTSAADPVASAAAMPHDGVTPGPARSLYRHGKGTNERPGPAATVAWAAGAWLRRSRPRGPG